MCFISTNLSKTVLILRRIYLESITNLKTSSCEAHVILPHEKNLEILFLDFNHLISFTSKPEVFREDHISRLDKKLMKYDLYYFIRFDKELLH